MPPHARSASLSSIRSLTASLASPKAIHHFLIPLLILFGIVIASAAQTEVAHDLLSTKGFNQPYFTFFLTHITFSLVFPVHLLILAIVYPKISIWTYINGIREIIADQLDYTSPSTTTWRDISKAWIYKVGWLTVLVSVPALCWFVAVIYTSAMEVTAIYATSSFHAYFFSMMLLKQPLSRVTAGSIALAFAGVIVISFAGGDDDGSGESAKGDGEVGGEGVAQNRVLGDLVMMCGAVLLGLYEVVYKLALPEGHGGVAAVPADLAVGYTPLPTHRKPSTRAHQRAQAHPLDEDEQIKATPTDSRSSSSIPPNSSLVNGYSNLGRGDLSRSIPLRPPSHSHHHHHQKRKASSTPLLSVHQNNLNPIPTPPLDPGAQTIVNEVEHENENHEDEDEDDNADEDEDDLDYTPRKRDSSITPPLPPALHANFLTSCIGLATVFLLWPPIFILHWTKVEVFRWPESVSVWAGLEVVAWSGAVYNAGLMVLIGIWGPTTSSVANLLTIGLVAVIDAIWIGQIPDLQTLIGVGMICVGFGVLLWEGEG